MKSIRQFAQELGVTEGAVRKAISSGRIPSEALGPADKGKIANPELAARCYRAGTQHSKGHQAGKGNPAHSETSKAIFAREMFRAKREQMRYEKEAGLLVPRSKLIIMIHTAASELKAKNKKHAALIDKFEAILRAAIDTTSAEVSDAGHT